MIKHFGKKINTGQKNVPLWPKLQVPSSTTLQKSTFNDMIQSLKFIMDNEI